jgi:hypothetical protein
MPYEKEGTYILIFVEQRKYEVRVKAPLRQAANKFAEKAGLFHRIASHSLGKVLRDGHDVEFECQDVIKSIAAEEDDYDTVIDSEGNEVAHGTR